MRRFFAGVQDKVQGNLTASANGSSLTLSSCLGPSAGCHLGRGHHRQAWYTPLSLRCISLPRLLATRSRGFVFVALVTRLQEPAIGGFAITAPS